MRTIKNPLKNNINIICELDTQNYGTPPIYLPKVSKILKIVTNERISQSILVIKEIVVLHIIPGNTRNVEKRLRAMVA